MCEQGQRQGQLEWGPGSGVLSRELGGGTSKRDAELGVESGSGLSQVTRGGSRGRNQGSRGKQGWGSSARAEGKWEARPGGATGEPGLGVGWVSYDGKLRS